MPEKHPAPSKVSARVLLSDLRQLWRELVTYEVLFKLLAASLITPLSAAMFSWLISLSGEVSLSNERIASFVCSPLGVLTAVVWLVVAFTITLAEESGLLVIAASGIRGQPLGAVSSILFGLRRTARFARLATLQIALAALVVLPLLGIAATVYLMMLGEHDINFYLAVRPPEFIVAVVIGGVLASIGATILGWLHLRWLFALPRCLLEDAGARQSMRESWQLTNGRLWSLAKLLLLWLICSSVLGLVVAWMVVTFADIVSGWVGESLSVLLPTLALLTALQVLAAVVVSFLSITSYSLLITRLYQEACQAQDAPFAAAVTADDALLSQYPRLLTKRRFAVSVAVALFLIASTSAWGMVELIELDQSFAVTAHRGSSQRAPENTMAAVELAIAEGADFIEIDVQETSDGQIVMLHDKDFMRLAGLNQAIWDTTYGELAEIDVGSWFGPEFSNQRVPLLSEVMNAVRGKAKLNIELKYNGHDQDLAKRVVQVIRDEDFSDQCVISSLDQQGLEQVQQLAPEINTGMITAVSIGDLSKTNADFLSIAHGRVTQSLVDAAHRQNKEIHVWTVNKTPIANRLLDMGVDNLLTDDPQLMVQLRQERAELTTPERLLLRFRRLLKGE